MKRYLVMVLAAVLVLGLPACRRNGNNTTENTQEEQPQPADPVADCRSLAPDDPYVDSDSAETAYAACSKAVQVSPNDAEIVYLLGTSALQNDLRDEALSSFERAEQLGNCKALYFLGDNAWYVNEDEQAAESYYKRGAECGDKRATRELFSPATFEGSAEPELIAALYNSDIEQLNKVRFTSASYVYGFYKGLGEQYLGPDFDPCWAGSLYRGGEILNELRAAEKGDASGIAEGVIYENVMPFAFQIMFPDQGSDALDERREALREAGRADVTRMILSSQCTALLPHKIVSGVEEFAKTKKRLFDVVREARPNIHSISDLSDLVRQEKL